MGCLTFIVRRLDGNLTLNANRKDGEGIRLSAALICSIGEFDGYFLLDVDMIRFLTNDNRFILVPEERPSEYFYIEDISGQDNTITITRAGSVDVSNVEYSSDAVLWRPAGGTQDTGTITIPLEANSKVYLRCRADSWNDVRISASGEHNVGGSLTSLLHGDDVHSSLKYGNEFVSLFTGDTKLVNADKLDLVSDVLTANCYQSMFQGCVNLLTAPALPATALASYCYSSMFAGCRSLAIAPQLPATNLADFCYSNMFFGCTLLTVPPALPATEISGQYCYSNMFRNCTSLTQTPALPATKLATACYSEMFRNCTSLETAPELPATEMEQRCYNGMFRGCSSLVSAPALSSMTLAPYCYQSMFQDCAALVTVVGLPALELERSCYSQMFRGCTSLETAPELPAETLVAQCYTMMFMGCTSLSYIKALFTTTPEPQYTGDWVYDVAEEGVFDKNPDATWFVRGSYGVPAGWIVPEEIPYFYVEDRSGVENTLTISRPYEHDVNDIEVSTDQSTWTNIGSMSLGPVTATIPANGKLYIRATASKWSGMTINAEQSFNIGGNILSLLYGTNAIMSFDGTVTLTETFQNLFTYSNIVDASELYLPDNVLANCYDSMFFGCYGLTATPVLPATTLAEQCYRRMFEECTALTDSPVLPATMLAEGCYEMMFNFCTGLTSTPALPATTLAPYCYSYMFNGCSSLTTAPALPAITLEKTCYSGMFANCTSLTAAPELSATTLAETCYDSMFANCASLSAAPALPVTTLASGCYRMMFTRCTSLTAAPALPATVLTPYCYESMFSRCTSLATPPALPATTLDIQCYKSMFSLCTALSTVPALPAETLADDCYNNMFQDCTLLTASPVLPAETLVSNCYYRMFYGCSNLSYIKALFMTTPGVEYTGDWVRGVSGEGTFEKNSEAIWNVRGVNGVPNGWTIPGEYHHFYVEDASGSDNSLLITRYGVESNLESLEYSYTGGTWYSILFSGELEIELPENGKIYLRSHTTKWYGVKISAAGAINIGGNILSLVYGVDDVYELAVHTNEVFAGLFNNSPVVDASELVMPQNVTDRCYMAMFEGCTLLTSAPELPALEMADYCYSTMFQGCTALEVAPELPATVLSSYCYVGMFQDCTSLTTAPTLPATILASYCYGGMFMNCTSLVKAPALPSSTLVLNCYNQMFSGCSSLNYIKALYTNDASSYSLNATFRWVYGVADEGLFVKDREALIGVGIDGIPLHWTIKNE